MMRAQHMRMMRRCFNTLDGHISAAIQDAAHGLSSPFASASRASPGWARLHSLGVAPATLGPAVHAYHGSGSDDDDLRSRELQGIHDILRRHVREGVPGSMSAAQHLHEGEARRVMRDPLAMLMMSRGVPLGISLKVQQDQQQEEDSSEAEEGKSSREHRLQDEVSTSGSDAGNGAASVFSSNQKHGTQSRVGRLMRTATGLVSDGGKLSRLMAIANRDSWDTTQESAAEIAQRIADSNSRASRSGGNGDGEGDDGNASDDEDDLKLPPEEDQKSFESVQADLRTMDEIFEILAQVPWLDDGVVEERELRGVATTGLLGTLEEVGWQLRPRVERIWAGERDSEAIIADMPEREQAALVSILFHTNQLEQKFGPPPTAAADSHEAQQGRSA